MRVAPTLQPLTPFMIDASPLLSAPSLESEAAFQLLFHQNPLPMWVFDDETLEFLVVNDAAVEKYGWSREEFLATTIDELLPAEDVEGLRAYRESLRTEGASVFNKTVAWQHRTKDGSQIDVESTWQEMEFEGRPALLMMTMDRAEQRQGEQRAEEQGKLLDLSADAILVRDLQHRVLFWNQGAERLYGWTSEEAVGLKAGEFFPNDAADFSSAMGELLTNGAWTAPLEQRRKDGAPIFVNSRWTLVRDEAGQPKSVLVINTDVTETKKLEAQFLRAQRLEAIGTLASGIAHDLNNILSPILMAIGLLRRSVSDASGERMLQIIESSADRGAGIVKQVLTFARGVEGERVLLQPRHLVSELSKIIAQTFPRNVDIQTHLPTELWTVNGDATQLHQVLLNLCVNARDAMPSGGALKITGENLEVDAHFASMNPGAQLGPHVALQVSDTGMGMSAETMAKIYDPFFTTKEVGKGTGLGLATVIGIVKSHSGFLTLQSELGAGTSFKIFLPATLDAAAAEEHAEAAIEPGHGELVLVVDDEAPLREALVQTLEANGYRAYTAEDGTDALALYHQRRDEIDLVLTDISMAQMDGVALVRALRRLNPDVRVIVSSGQFQSENLTILGGLGVTTLLDKPYPAAKLLRAVHAVLREPRKTRS